MTNPIRDALTHLITEIDLLAAASEGVSGLDMNGGLEPWSSLLEGGESSIWLGDAIAAGRAALAAEPPAPAAVPVAVAERPWEREGWCDVEGRCWWFNRAGIPEWQLADGGPYGDFCLPHWAIPDPQSPQGGEVAE
jgi:hypothetical protein